MRHAQACTGAVSRMPVSLLVVGILDTLPAAEVDALGHMKQMIQENATRFLMFQTTNQGIHIYIYIYKYNTVI